MNWIKLEDAIPEKEDINFFVRLKKDKDNLGCFYIGYYLANYYGKGRGVFICNTKIENGTVEHYLKYNFLDFSHSQVHSYCLMVLDF